VSNEDQDNEEVERTTHSFVMKIWREERGRTAGRTIWRGYITHVPDGERRYVKHLSEIVAFIVPYLEQLGVRIGVPWRVRRWMFQRRTRQR
jgi:hypothetical protein